MTIKPEGEELREAVKWISEQRKKQNEKSIIELIEQAGIKFDLSPVNQDYLIRFFKQ